MAAKLLEILEGLRELGYAMSWIHGDLNGWKIMVYKKGAGVYDYPVEPGIVSPYRTVESVVREIVEEVKQYGQS